MAEDVSITTFTLNQKKNNKANLWISTDLYLNIFFPFFTPYFQCLSKEQKNSMVRTFEYLISIFHVQALKD